MAKQYTITDLASEFDVTTRTIRFYEEKGLLTPAREGQTRVFSSADRTRLKLILRGKRLGLSLEESHSIITMYDPSSGNRQQLQTLLTAIRNKREQLQQQLQDLTIMLNEMNEAEQRCMENLDLEPQPEDHC